MKRSAWIWIGLLLLAFAAGQWFASRNAHAPASIPSNPTSARQAPVPPARDCVDSTSPLPGASSLTAEAQDTLARILAGGPFAHRQDGSVFGNRERLLPAQPRGWYREYTVETPGGGDRGAHRIVAGGDPPSEFWYSDDHYRSFRRIDARGASR